MDDKFESAFWSFREKKLPHKARRKPQLEIAVNSNTRKKSENNQPHEPSRKQAEDEADT